VSGRRPEPVSARQVPYLPEASLTATDTDTASLRHCVITVGSQVEISGNRMISAMATASQIRNGTAAL